MKKKILFILPLSFLVVACSQPGLVKVDACVDRRPDREQCVDNRGGGTTAFVNVTPKGWAVAPKNVCVTEGDTLEIRFLGPPPAQNTIGTIPKGNSEVWLVGRNVADQKKITLTVSAKPDDDDHVDYFILSASDGCVDPRVTYN